MLQKLNFWIYIIIVFSLTINCSNKKDNEPRAMNDTGRSLFVLELRIRFLGDTIAYDDLYIESLDIQNGEEVLYENAKIMADKYDYLPAHIHIYELIRESYPDKKNTDLLSINIPKEKRYEALKNLKHCVNKGSVYCMYLLGEYYKIGRFFPKDTIKAKQLKIKAFKIEYNQATPEQKKGMIEWAIEKKLIDKNTFRK